MAAYICISLLNCGKFRSLPPPPLIINSGLCCHRSAVQVGSGHVKVSAAASLILTSALVLSQLHLDQRKRLQMLEVPAAVVTGLDQMSFNLVFVAASLTHHRSAAYL